MNIIRKRHILQKQIWILFLTSCVTNMNKNIILKNIHEYIRIFEYLKIIKPKITATYQSEDCPKDIKNFL